MSGHAGGDLFDDGRAKGYIKIARRFFDGDPWWLESRTFSRCEAWIDLIQQAQFKSYQHATVHGVIQLERGEFVASVRHLADRWGWSVKRVWSFLATAQKWKRLRKQRETGVGTVYLIENYEVYQSSSPEGPCRGETPRETRRKRQGNKNEAGSNTCRRQLRHRDRESDVAAVLDHYRHVHPDRRPDEIARRAIRKALHTYAVAEINDAIDGNAADEWHREHGKHDLGYVLRNNELIDNFRALHREQQPRVVVDEATGTLNALGLELVGAGA